LHNHFGAKIVHFFVIQFILNIFFGKMADLYLEIWLYFDWKFGV